MCASEEVISCKLEVPEGLGLHARVATLIVKKLQSYTCRVTLKKAEVEVDARSVLGILLLAAAPGEEITVSAYGPLCREAIEEIRRLVENEAAE